MLPLAPYVHRWNDFFSLFVLFAAVLSSDRFIITAVIARVTVFLSLSPFFDNPNPAIGYLKVLELRN